MGYSFTCRVSFFSMSCPRVQGVLLYFVARNAIRLCEGGRICTDWGIMRFGEVSGVGCGDVSGEFHSGWRFGVNLVYTCFVGI